MLQTQIPEGLYVAEKINIRTMRKAIDLDDTNSLERAIAAVAAIGGGEVRLPADRETVVSDVIKLPVASSTHVRVSGSKGFNSRIRRASGYSAGIFKFDGTLVTNCTIAIEGLFFFSDSAADVSPGSPTIDLVGPSPQAILIADCQFWDQYIAISNTGVQNVWIRGCAVHNSLQALTAASKFGGNAGFAFQGHIANNIISDCSIFGQAVLAIGQLTHGIYIAGADGIQICNCAITAQNGVTIAGGNGVSIDDVYFSNCVIDNCNQCCVHITGNNTGGLVFTNIRFTGCHIDAGTSWDQVTSPSAGIVIDGNADCIQFIGCNIGLADRYGVYINGATSWTGAAKKSILFQGCQVADNNKANFGSIPGVYINAPGVSFVGGSSGNINGSGHQKYGVSVGPSGGGALIVGNRLAANDTSPTLVDVAATGCVVANNV